MANPPVCRIMDYGKFRYEESQKAKESRKKTIQVSIKEVKFRPKIGKGDFDTKVRHMQDFLAEGHKVKVTLQFRGREMAHPELGSRILDAVIEQVGTARQGRDPCPARRSQHDDGARTGEESSRQEVENRTGQRPLTQRPAPTPAPAEHPHRPNQRRRGSTTPTQHRRGSTCEAAPADQQPARPATAREHRPDTAAAELRLAAAEPGRAATRSSAT